jgi:fluoroacetyl-CoA thioesterase
MSQPEITIGQMFNETFTVKDEWAADVMGSGGVPVLGTPALILAVEIVAASNLTSQIENGCTTVGTKMEITHLYPTAIGGLFSIELLLNKASGSRIEFTFTAKSDGKVIASGIHRRSIVNIEKFLNRLEPSSPNNQ